MGILNLAAVLVGRSEQVGGMSSCYVCYAFTNLLASIIVLKNSDL